MPLFHDCGIMSAAPGLEPMEPGLMFTTVIKRGALLHVW